MALSVIVGAQWGDEGKGKWIDYLAKDADIICRFQGGNNAGHTIYVEDQKVVLHLLPNGVFYKDKIVSLSSGVVIDPSILWEEINLVRKFVPLSSDRLWISPLAHIITPWDVHKDCLGESSTSKPIGTTKRGIGPAYSAKASRSGLRMNRFIDSKERTLWYEENSESNPDFLKFYKENPSLWQNFEEKASYLKDFMAPTERLVQLALKDEKRIICEGAQGTLLDISHGTYPYVTSSSTVASQAAVSLGIDPRKINTIYGIAKAYTTRVGKGPFPTELLNDTGALIAKKGNEFGATTKRPRRCGWFDAVAMRFACEINGLDGIYLTKLDILSHFNELKIAIAYEHPKLGVINYYPSDIETLKDCTPVYKTFKGWHYSLPESGDFSSLPINAQKFVRSIEEYLGCKILGLGCGPGRHDFLTIQ